MSQQNNYLSRDTDNSFSEKLIPAACQLLKRHLRIPATEFITSVDLFKAANTTGTCTF